MEISEEQINKVSESLADAERREEKSGDKPHSKEDSNLITCPCCGKNTLRKPFKLDPAWMDQYMACMLTGEPYSQEYQLFHGNVNLVVTSVSMDTADKMNKALSASEGLGHFTEELDAVEAARQMIQVYYMIREISITVKGKKSVFRPSEVVDKVIDSILSIRSRLDAEEITKDELASELHNKVVAPMKDASRLSGIPLPTLKTVVLIHDQMLRVLTESAFDPTFWSRIKLA